MCPHNFVLQDPACFFVLPMAAVVLCFICRVFGFCFDQVLVTSLGPVGLALSPGRPREAQKKRIFSGEERRRFVVRLGCCTLDIIPNRLCRPMCVDAVHPDAPLTIQSVGP